jgi:hypothetical protein
MLPRSDFPGLVPMASGGLAYEDRKLVINHPIVQAALEQFKQKIGFYNTRQGPPDEVARGVETVTSLAKLSQLLRTSFPDVYFARMGNDDGDDNQRKLVDLSLRVGQGEKIVRFASGLESATPIFAIVDRATQEKITRAYAASEMSRAR